MTKSKLTMRIPFFRSRRHTDNNGNTYEFTESELRAVAANYKPSLLKTQLVIGRPKNDDPFYGCVDSIELLDEDENTQLVPSSEVELLQHVGLNDLANKGKHLSLL